MGRKQNANFTRGAKLNDSSNRYEHTCKSCAEKFPKGRNDSLLNHLIHKCPSMSQANRQQIMLAYKTLSADANDGGTPGQHGEVQLNGPTVALPINAGAGSWTALHALAEASRQVEVSEKHDDRSVENRSVGPHSRTPEGLHSDALEVQEQYTVDNPPVSYGQHGQREKKTTGLKNRTGEASLYPAAFHGHIGSRSTSPNLAMTAAAAAQFAPSMVDPLLDPQLLSHDATNTEVKMVEDINTATNTSMSEEFFHTSTSEQSNGNTWPMLDGSGGSRYPDPHHLPQGIDMNDSTTPPYSGNTVPLTTEFAAEYGTGQVTKQAIKPKVRVLASREASAIQDQVAFHCSSHNIEASHYPETTVFAELRALSGQRSSNEGKIDPGLTGDGNVTLRILDHENDDLPMKLEAYIKRMMPIFFEREPSHFMNFTLGTAYTLSLQKEDTLLKVVLELWVTVHILVDHELRWNIYEKTDLEARAGSGPVIDQNTADRAYAVITLQLNAAAEKKAAAFCKNALSELERRLLHTLSNYSMEIYLAGLIILNCIEKSTWLFKHWEQDSFKSRWPLAQNPDSFAAQGDRVTDMIQMLLRIRHVPPKTYARTQDGILATEDAHPAREFLKNVQLNGKCS
ncbi:hypothetical protein B7494_g1409 [Chlorociboria aeruginascens]|nr:hypothetical protein B7494_g1409 [Chlorociboria aeruginascens]